MTAASRLTGVLVLVALLCAACTDDGERPPPSTEQTTADPVAVEPEALWQGGTGRANEIPQVEIRGESVLVFGNTADELERVLLVADAATGDVRWQLDNQASLPGNGSLRAGSIGYDNVPIVGADDDWTAFVPYSAAAREFGVAALAGADGAVRWASPPVRDPAAATQQVLDASDDVVVSAVNIFDDRHRATASDAATGRRLWETPGVLPQFVVGDIVLAQTGVPRSLAPGASEPSPDSGVVGLDAATGRTKWDLPGSKVFLTLRELAVVSVPGRKLVVDTATGRQVGDLGAVAYCVSDQASLFVCSSDDAKRLIFFDVTSRKVSQTEVALSLTFSAWHGYVFLEDRVVDRFGKVVTDELPGRVIAMSEDYVVLADDAAGEFAVHRRAD